MSKFTLQTRAFLCSVIKQNPLKWQTETCSVTEDPPSQTCTCRSRKTMILLTGWRNPDCSSFGYFNGWVESFHAQLVSWQVEYQKNIKKTSNSVISKHRENVISFPEKSGLLWKWCTFSSHKLVNIYNRIRPGKREWKLYLFFVILEILDCGIMQLISSVQRSLGFEHNVIILHCTGNCAHATTVCKVC